MTAKGVGGYKIALLESLLLCIDASRHLPPNSLGFSKTRQAENLVQANPLKEKTSSTLEQNQRA
jgi:hypothetical protein